MLPLYFEHCHGGSKFVILQTNLERFFKRSCDGRLRVRQDPAIKKQCLALSWLYIQFISEKMRWAPFFDFPTYADPHLVSLIDLSCRAKMLVLKNTDWCELGLQRLEVF